MAQTSGPRTAIVRGLRAVWTGKVAEMTIKVRELLTEADIEVLAEVVSASFLDYPVMVRAFASTPGDRKNWIRRMVTASARARRQAEIPTWVAEMDARIVAGAFLKYPDRQMSKEIGMWWDRFVAEAGSETGEFFDRFIAASQSIEPPEPNLYLAMIGVLPEFQGRGLGRALMDHVATEAAKIEGCKGVALDTELESNVGLYERCGFQVIGQTSVGDLPIWVMFREI